MCVENKRLFDIVDPGLSTSRGKLFYEIAESVFQVKHQTQLHPTCHTQSPQTSKNIVRNQKMTKSLCFNPFVYLRLLDFLLFWCQFYPICHHPHWPYYQQAMLQSYLSTLRCKYYNEIAVV
jgi:hypothetical protein